MAKVTTAFVKELREVTGARMMDCKKCLVEIQAALLVRDMSREEAMEVLAKEVIEFCAWKEYYSEEVQNELQEYRRNRADTEAYYNALAYCAGEVEIAPIPLREKRKDERIARAERALNALMNEIKRIKEGGEALRQKCLNVWASAHNLHSMCRKVAACGFKFDLQLFAARKEDNMNNHISSKAYIKSLKSDKGNALAYNVKVFADKNGKISAVLNREMAEITALNEQFLCRNFTMADLRGKEIIVEKAFNGYATLDVSACVASKNKNARNAGAVVALNEILIGSYDGETVVCMRHADDEVMVVLSGKNKWTTIPMVEAVDEDGHTRDGWMRFGSYKLYGASKGRKNLFDMYEQDSSFEDTLDCLTYGVWAKVEGLSLNGK